MSSKNPVDEQPCCGSHEGSHQDPAPETLVVEKEVNNGEKKIRIAVVGCSHGEMDAIYEVKFKKKSYFSNKINGIFQIYFLY